MTIAVFSDSHNDVQTMSDLVRSLRPDMVLHLGDHSADARALRRLHPALTVHSVRGNTDSVSSDDEELLLTIENRRVLLCHGHGYRVKNGVGLLAARAARDGVYAALFGHTHQPYLCCHSGVWLFNPGRVGRRAFGGQNPTYGVIRAEGGEFSFSIAQAEA